jgi:preprotein translocase subunit SecE
MAKREEPKDQELDDSDEEHELAEGREANDPEAALAKRGAEGSSADEDALTEAADDADAGEAAALGVARYVHAAFFGAGILAAYLSGKLVLAGWNMLADWPEAVRRVPQLIQYGEDERGTLSLLVGAVIGVFGVIWYYRKESVRKWAGEVATELSRVTWPNKETVTNGTIVVLVASLVATVYVALLDRFWGYLTSLVYGA